MWSDSTLQQRVYLVLDAIPYGKVSTYGDIARFAGAPSAARQVGRILKNLPRTSTLPWYRVINSQGKVSLSGENLQRQRQALQQEGVAVSPEGRIPLKLYRWQG
ncbi:MAG: DNA base-flipping protein [Candidatus Erwinia impunctatus]|nr:DNA base-flipping protein [Culicoides impunctatus]